jgi:hypothetical protein
MKYFWNIFTIYILTTKEIGIIVFSSTKYVRNIKNPSMATPHVGQSTYPLVL